MVEVLKKLIKKCLVFILSRCNHNSIVFESIPDLSDNTKYVYDEMIRRGINKKYKMIWLCKENGTRPSVYNTKYVSQLSFGGLFSFFYVAKSKCIICCNTFIPSNGDYQKSIYLLHGLGFKDPGKYLAPDGINNSIGLSEITNEYCAPALHLSVKNMLVTGFPRNDILFEDTRDKVSSLFNKKYSKIIVWYPTYRQHVKGEVVNSTITLPIIHNMESAIKINEMANKRNILIVLKPHFSQDVSCFKKQNLSNITFIDDKFFEHNHMTSYEFVAGCDALITDYSSIYTDYLLCDKPVAAIWEDIEEYKAMRGFVVDIDYYMKGARKIYDVSDFVNFINEIGDDNDTMRISRHEITDVIHTYKDNKSTERVVDFIVENYLN